MLDFNMYLARHGEVGVQTIIEQIERREGIASSFETALTLEERWNAVMQATASQPVAA
jgi:hypothetical protein